MSALLSRLRGGVVALAVSVLAACSGSTPASPDSSERIGELKSPLNNSEWPVQSFVALNSIALRDSATLTGDVAVVRRATGAVLAHNVELSLAKGSKIVGNVKADSLNLATTAAVQGSAEFNDRTGQGTVSGTVTTPLGLPLPITLPAQPSVSPNSSDVTVNAGATRVLAPGAYRDITLRNNAVLSLSGGVYQLATLNAQDSSRVECTNPCEVRANGVVTLHQNTRVGPVSGASFGAASVQLLLSRAGARPGDSTQPLTIQSGAIVTAYVLALNGTARIQGNVTFSGKLVARDINVAADSSGTGFNLPALTSEPQDLTVRAGQSATFSVVATGQALSYQWTRGGSDIAGATQATFQLNTTAASDNGALFAVRVKNAAGSVTSRNARLTVQVCTTSDTTCNGIDDDCDGSIDEDFVGTSITCGVGACAATGARVCDQGAVKDVCQPGTPAASDATCNGVDDDCDGNKDEDFTASVTHCGAGACSAAGQSSCVNGSLLDSCAPGTPAATDATCNGVDDDCNGEVDEDYVSLATQCGAGACSAAGVTACVAGQVRDSCLPGTGSPTDTTCNGIDDDCDGRIDDDYVAIDTRCGAGSCTSAGRTSCAAGGVLDSCTPGTPASSDETCDGIDANCNGAIDEGYRSHTTICGVGACRRSGTSTCAFGVEENGCIPGPSAANDATCDGVDDDCDGQVDEDFVTQATSCGVGACTAHGTSSCQNGKVVDNCSPGAAAVSDVSCDGVDDDCDGQVDEDFQTRTTSCGVGACQRSGEVTCAAGVEQTSCRSGSPASSDATCNGVDDDCDGSVDEEFPTTSLTCGLGVCQASGLRSCSAGTVHDDCTPTAALGPDTTCDGRDDNCDGSVDEGFVPATTNCGVGACAARGVTSCAVGQVLDSCRPGAAASTDATCNGVDDNCDGLVDEGYAPHVITCGAGACTATGFSRCESGVENTSCTPGQGATNDATCNGVDDDCDGRIDEDYVARPTACGRGVCAGTGATSCVGGVEADSCVAANPPAVSDSSCNGLDDDCDGNVDEDYAAQITQCGLGACHASGATSCVGGAESNSCRALNVAAPDDNCNGIDDDCDGSVDQGFVPQSTSCGVGACARTGQITCVAGAVQNSCQAGSAVGPDNTCDGVDDDCDGSVDEEVGSTPIRCGVGACQADGVRVCTTGSLRNLCVPGNPASSDANCNNVDDDCDGRVDEDFASEPTQCGAGACQTTGATHCDQGVVSDSCSATGGGGNDAICDGIDSDCDGAIDEAYAPHPTTCGVGACARTGMSSCVAGQESPGCVAGTPTSDANCNGIDDDCDGSIDEDYQGHPTTCGVGVCAATGTSQCVGGVEQPACTDLPPVGPDTTCNGVDDDCNGSVDDAFVVTGVNCGIGACATTGSITCQNGQLSNDCRAGTGATSDATCNGIDDDCDGSVDEDYAAPTTNCGVGACRATGELRCVAGATQDTCRAGTAAAEDASCNGVDDDCDGRVDEDYQARSTSCGRGACAAQGTTACQTGREVDSCAATSGAAQDTVCNGIDDDCDGSIDEDFATVTTTCGAGACAASGSKTCTGGSEHDSCSPLAAATSDANCNGVDDDCDGSTDEDYVAPVTSCGVGACVAAGHDNCVAGQLSNDCRAGTGATSDATCNGVDDDCDGSIDEEFVGNATNCGVGACARTGTEQCQAGQVVNTCAAANPASDANCNGIDDDCDGAVDEDYLPTATTCGAGACQAAGELRCVGGQLSNTCRAGSSAPDDHDCNGVDDDCDGSIDEDFLSTPTQCGTGACQASGSTSCVGGVVQNSCQGGTSAGSDATCDGIDNDCDGTVDNGYLPRATTCGVGACVRTGTTSCITGRESDTCVVGTAASTDATCNGVDDDCDGSVDEDYVAPATTCGVGACAATGSIRCQGGTTVVDCSVGTPTSDATCNGVDDDCDGSVDEDYVATPTSCGVGACAATGSTRCEAGRVSSTCVAGNPATLDASCDGIDNDCDGSVDEDYLPESVSCGVGACVRSGQTRCQNGSVEPVCTVGTAATTDADCNGLDDDCDGSIDEDYVGHATTCGQGNCSATGTSACQAGREVDSCRAGAGAASDTVCNGIDDDCDGSKDEDYVPVSVQCGVGVCAATGTTACQNGAVVPACTPGTPVSDDSNCNGVDDDCDGSIDEAYVPLPVSCGIGACRATGVTSCQSGVEAPQCAQGRPATADATCDGIDDDCDGSVDEDYAQTPTSCGLGACSATGHTACAAGQVSNTCAAGQAATSDATCNGIDDDCDGSVDEDYASRTTNCGVGACAATGATSCTAGSETNSCAPRTAATSDATCNGVDDDCDGSVDEDYVGTATSCGVGACAATGTTSCSAGQVSDSCRARTPATGDASCDGIDDDCDGSVDEDYVPQQTVCGVGACRTTGSVACQSGRPADTCTPLPKSGDDSDCDGVDDNCNGQADENFATRCAGTAVETCSTGALQTQECLDTNVCNGSESCSAGRCVAGTPVSTSDGNPCTADSCDAGGVAHMPLALGADCGTSRVCDGQGTCIGKPVITTQPSSVTVSPGGDANFGVSATGALLSYQWRRLGQPIPGATSATFTLPSVQPADNGTEITVAVSNPAGNVVSSAVTLTVSDTSGPVLTIDGDAQRNVATDTAVLTGTALDNGQPAASVVATSSRFPGEVAGIVDIGSGAFRIEIPVSPGVNAITLTAKDAAGNATQKSVVATLELSRLPRVTLTEPLNGLETQADKLDVKGYVRSSLAPEQIRLVLGTAIIFPTGTGGEYSFSFKDVRLNLGPNLLSVRAETPDGTVTAQAAVLRSEPGTVSDDAPVVAVIGGASLQFVKDPTLPIKGTVTAKRCTSSVTVNGASAPLTGAGSSISFASTLQLPAGDAEVPVEIIATDCDGHVGKLIYKVIHDDVAPVIDVALAPSPAVHNASTTPYLIVGKITESHLATVSSSQQSLGVLPGAPGSYDFTFAVPLTRGQDDVVTVDAVDQAGNSATYSITLHLDATVDIEIISPVAGSQIQTLKDPLNVDVVARIVGLPTDFSAVVRLDNGGVYPLTRADSTFKTTLSVRGTTASHSLTISVLNGSGTSVASQAVPFKVTDANSIPVVASLKSPVGGSSNVEANEPVVIELNRPVSDPTKIKIELTETVHGKRYKPYALGSSISEFTNVQLEDVNRDQEAVPGGMSFLPGDRLYAFYPARDYGYGGQVSVRILNDGAELTRSQFNVRALPTLMTGFVGDQFLNPIPELDVRLDDIQVTTQTNVEGVFSLGFGKAQDSIPAGRHKLVINPGLRNPSYGVIERWINLQAGRMQDLGVVSVPLLDAAEPFRRIAGGQASVLLRGGDLELDLSQASLLFPDGTTEGDVHTDLYFGPAVGYPAISVGIPLVSYGLQPMGIQVSGPFAANFALPPTGDSNYADALPDYVLLVGLDPEALQLVPIGVGRVDHAQHRVRSARALEARRLDFIGMAPLSGSSFQSLFSKFADGLVDLPTLTMALEKTR